MDNRNHMNTCPEAEERLNEQLLAPRRRPQRKRVSPLKRLMSLALSAVLFGGDLLWHRPSIARGGECCLR